MTNAGNISSWHPKGALPPQGSLSSASLGSVRKWRPANHKQVSGVKGGWVWLGPEGTRSFREWRGTPTSERQCWPPSACRWLKFYWISLNFWAVLLHHWCREWYSRCQGGSFCNINQSGLKLCFLLICPARIAWEIKGSHFSDTSLFLLVWKNTMFSQMVIRMIPPATLELQGLTAHFLAALSLVTSTNNRHLETRAFSDIFLKAGWESSYVFHGFPRHPFICAVCDSPLRHARHLGYLL